LDFYSKRQFMKKILKIVRFLIILTLIFFVSRSCYHAHQIANLKSMIMAGDAAGVSHLIGAHPKLIECDVMSGDRHMQITPLSFAANLGQYTICSNLIAAGANVNAQDEAGLTPLHWALNMSDTNIVILLLQHGADVTIKADGGLTALDFANQRTTSRYLQQLLSEATFKATNRLVSPK
jgi:hypothetical protein